MAGYSIPGASIKQVDWTHEWKSVLIKHVNYIWKISDSITTRMILIGAAVVISFFVVAPVVASTRIASIPSVGGAFAVEMLCITSEVVVINRVVTGHVQPDAMVVPFDVRVPYCGVCGERQGNALRSIQEHR